MEHQAIDESVLRSYLLGHLENDHDLVEHIDQRLLTDPEFSMSADIIEDEIIEEYLEDTLEPADRRAVERYFLRPPERQRKLRSARLLSRQLAAAPLHANRPEEQNVTPRETRGRLRILTFPSFRTWAEIAASVLFATSISYMWNLQHGLEVALKQSTLQTAQLRTPPAILKQQAQAPRSFVESSTVMLTLGTPGLLRGDTHLPEVELPAASGTLHVGIALTFGPSTNHQVRLRQSGTVVWSQTGVQATAVQGGSILAVNIPAAAVPSGMCELVITTTPEVTQSYWFRVAKTP